MIGAYGGVILDNLRFEACEATTVLADLDHDGSVTLLDNFIFTDCLSGPNIGYSAPCAQADYDFDGDVDVGDYGMFLSWFGD